MFYLKLALMILFQPQQAFVLIKRRRKTMPAFVPILLFLLALGVNILMVYLTHFPLADKTPENTNLLEIVFSFLLPLMSMVGGIYLVTTIRDGETTFYETFAAIAYCLTPYILCTPLIGLLSRILSANEVGLYQTLNTLVFLWCAILAIYSVSAMNTYSFSQTIGNCVLAVLAVLFLWAMLILLYLLGEKLFGFFAEVFEEYRLMRISA